MQLNTAETVAAPRNASELPAAEASAAFDVAVPLASKFVLPAMIVIDELLIVVAANAGVLALAMTRAPSRRAVPRRLSVVAIGTASGEAINFAVKNNAPFWPATCQNALVTREPANASELPAAEVIKPAPLGLLNRLVEVTPAMLKMLPVRRIALTETSVGRRIVKCAAAVAAPAKAAVVAPP